jgi:Zn-dependent metalloprotease
MMKNLAMHSCGCHFIPPHINRHIAQYGGEDYREQALNDLELSFMARGQRLIDNLSPQLPKPITGHLTRYIFSAENTTNTHLLKIPLLANEGDDNLPARSVDRLYDLLGQFYEALEKLTGFNSIDNQGYPLIGIIHYGKHYNNAVWNGVATLLGDGDNRLFKSFIGSPTAVFHELWHGVIQYLNPLPYYGESGAINESYADVGAICFQAAILEQTIQQMDWLIGKELFTANVNGKAVRSMKAPGTAYDDLVLGKDPQPNHYTKRYVGFADKGGVHINSGILNRFFQLCAVGLDSWENAFLIWWNVLPELNKPTFLNFAQRVEDTAKLLFGEKTRAIVAEARNKVGLVQTLSLKTSSLTRHLPKPDGQKEKLSNSTTEPETENQYPQPIEVHPTTIATLAFPPAFPGSPIFNHFPPQRD